MIVPEEVEIEIELVPAGTDVPWFCANIPVAPELIVTPDVVVTSIAAKVEIAEMPVDVVPVMVAPLPDGTGSGFGWRGCSSSY